MASKFNSVDFALYGQIEEINWNIFRMRVTLSYLHEALQRRDSDGFLYKARQLLNEQTELKGRYELIKKFDRQVCEQIRTVIVRVQELVTVKFLPDVKAVREEYAAADQPPSMTFMRMWFVEKLKSEKAEAEADGASDREETGATAVHPQQDNTTVRGKTEIDMEECSVSCRSFQER